MNLIGEPASGNKTEPFSTYSDVKTGPYMTKSGKGAGNYTSTSQEKIPSLNGQRPLKVTSAKR